MKSIKLLSKRILVILMILLTLFPCLFSGISLAVDSTPIQLTTERAGNYVATFGINFYKNWSSINYVSTETNSAPKGKASVSGNDTFVWPIDPDQYTVTSEFGPRSLDNHKGMDFGAVKGTPVYSSCSGTVVQTYTQCTHNYAKNASCGCGGGYGNHIVIDSGNGVGIIYGHLTDVLVNVGDEVQQGEQIGTVGSTGWSTGDHLHFEFITNDITGVDSKDYIVRSSMAGYGYSVNPRLFVDDGATISGGIAPKSKKSTQVKKYGEIKTAYDNTADEKSKPIDPSDETYKLSNKSWIDFTFKNALGLEGTNYYPTSNLSNDSKYYEKIGESQVTDDGVLDINSLMSSGQILPGDILYTYPNKEYLLYVGGTKVIYATKPYKEEDGALKYEYLDEYFVKQKNAVINQIKQQIPEAQRETAEIDEPICGVTDIYRLNDTLLTELNIKENTERLFFNGKGYFDPNTSYSGTPTKGSYKGVKKFHMFTLADVFWFVINALTYVIRAVIVGFVNLFNLVIQSTVKYLSGNTSELPMIDEMRGVSETSYSSDSISIESIFFNRIPIVDANFFNYESAGGHLLVDENGEHTMLYTLRQYLAVWYTIIRNFSIGIMLFILIYIGIKMALTASAEKKADYKKMIINWVQGLGIVLFIHLFMYMIFYGNNAIVDLLYKLMQTTSSKIIGPGVIEAGLYEAVRTKAYAFDIREGTVGLIFYIMLIYLLVRFLLIYLKRAIAIYILAMSGSFMGVKYAIDKANGKKTTSLSTWAKDFAFNVLLQSIHCLMYVLLLSVALSTALKSFTGLIIGIVILQFMLQADKIFMKIFNIRAKGGVFEGVQKPESYFTLLTKARIATSGLRKTVGAIGNTVTGKNKVGEFMYMMHYADEDDSIKDAKEKVEIGKLTARGKRAVWFDNFARNGINIRGRNINLPIGILQALSSTERQKLYRLLAQNSSLDAKRNIYKNIQDAKQKSKKHYTRHITTLKNLGVGTFNMLAGVGFLAEGITPAMHRTIKGVKMNYKELHGRDERRYRRLHPYRNDDPNKKYLNGPLGALGNLQAKEEMAVKKYEKDMKKIKGKQEALKLITNYESDINNRLDRMFAGKTEAERKELFKNLQQTVKNTRKTDISAGKVSQAVGTYMYKKGNLNGKLEDSDLDGIMDELQGILDRKSTNKINVQDTSLKNRIMANIAGGTLHDKSGKEAAALITDAINKFGVVDISSTFRTSLNTADPSVAGDFEDIAKALKNAYGTNEKSKIENKGAADSTADFIKEIYKKYEEV